ncbi:helix-turn-helix transcriptional regulator [Lacticaseibacillus hulanensis]|jgi:transcriptional regulator with XRE-family HTH domain|uniref:helix-turn-helix transcriptional regulator n=1 Tax=Lacticaseibacillus hulanensis TaxID=2493111 RepID=UPI000FDBAD3E|nr:helix-turn-helix transcriptional regulator [Lacticaseibacillus hulanensis]
MGLGKQFKYIRARKNFTLEMAATGITTTNALAAFEAGKKDMPLEKMQELLLRMGVSLRQFANISDRLSQTSQDARTHIHELYLARDTAKLADLFSNPIPVAAGDEVLAFLDHMLIAGKYYDLTGKQLCTDEEVENLTTMLLENLSWDEAELDVLFWTLRLMNDNRVFMLSREVLNITESLRDWNFALYGAAWRSVLEGLAVLVERNSNFASTLMRQIDMVEPMAEVLIANRSTYMFLKAIMVVQKEDTEGNRELVADVYRHILPLHSTELEDNLRKINVRTLNLEL